MILNGVAGGAPTAAVVSWESMTNRTLSMVHVIAAAAACSALVALAPLTASAAPTSDSRGYVDSTARCASPSEAVVFGSTATSRVAICKSADGEYEYRGVRVRDGARLIVAASESGDGFIAKNDGITYTVTETSLVVSAGSRVIREETMVDFHGALPDVAPSAPPEETSPTTPLPPPLPAEVGGDGT